MCDRPAWRGFLYDGVAALTSQFRTHMADHAEAGQYELKLFVDILAQLVRPAGWRSGGGR